MKIHLIFADALVSDETMRSLIGNRYYVKIATDEWDNVDFSNCHITYGQTVEGNTIDKTIVESQYLFDVINERWAVEYPYFYVILDSDNPQDADDFYDAFAEYEDQGRDILSDSGSDMSVSDFGDDYSYNEPMDVVYTTPYVPVSLSDIPSAAENCGGAKVGGKSKWWVWFG